MSCSLYERYERTDPHPQPPGQPEPGTREGDDVGTGRLADTVGTGTREGADVGTGRLADTVDINWWYNISVFVFREGDAGDAVGTGGVAEDLAEGSRDLVKGPSALVCSLQRRRCIV